MANDYEYLNNAGVIVADTADTLQAVQTEYKNALGQDLIVTPDTPQGVLITAEALARDRVIRNNVALANQINPNLAGGVFLDAIMALTGSARDVAKRTTVTATLSGVPGTNVPAGVVAATSNGDKYTLDNSVVIGASGTVVGAFSSVEFGPIAAAENTLTTIVDGVLGWENVTNGADVGVLGQLTQSDVAARFYRRNTLALQGRSLAEAIMSNLYAVDGVRSLTFRENITNATATIDGISLVAHSVWACVDGGTNIAVATAYREGKSGGANYNGAISQAVTDPFSGQVTTVKFDRPTAVPILARVTVRASSSVVDPSTAVKTAILAFADGILPEEPGFTVGSDVSTFELSGAINRQYPSLYVQKVEVAKASAPSAFSTDPIDISLNQKATITSGSITVTII